ncbi:MAG: putative drug exporter of the superfamily [Gaiellales bacterium]|jgi:RND superfamily putative drug exporter|nr:putative drug exporter of the superfamily [Gaiellales bacterium]
MERLILRSARFATRRPWWVVAVWVVLLIAALPFAGKAQSQLSSGGFDVPGSQSVQAIDYLNEQPGRGAYSITFLIDAPDPTEAVAAVAQVQAEVMRTHPEIRFTAPQVASPDGKTVLAVGFAPYDQNESLRVSRELKTEIQRTRGETRIFVLGPSSNYATFQDITEEDLQQAELISAPVILVVLLLLFGAVVAALVPAVLGALAVLITFAIVYFIASNTEVSVYATTMVTMIGIGVAVDYSMFILARFREELDAGHSTESAVENAMRTSGTAVVFSGLTVIVSLASIWIVPVRAIQSMALAAIIVVTIAVLAGTTLLPAVLALLGPRVNALRIGRRRRLEGGGFWYRWSQRVMRRPVLAALGSSALLIVLAVPAFDMVTANRALEQLPPTTDVRVGNKILSDRITGEGQGREGALTILVRPQDARGASVESLAERLRRRLARDPLIARTSIDRVGPSAIVVGQLRVDPEGAVAVDTLVPRVRKWVDGHGLVSGVSAFNRDLNAEVGDDLWKVMALVLALSYIVLLVLLRSVLLPLKAVIMNLLSIGAAYGVVVLVFQWGWFDWTGFDSLGHLNTINPSLMLAITFGLAMDYEVFLLSRIRERYEATGDNERAVAEGLAGSARIITSAAMIMTVVFASFVGTGVPAIKEIGLGLAVAIAIDATITRLVLVPATMRLLGEWNWWLPGWLDRLLPHLAHEPPARPEPT